MTGKNVVAVFTLLTLTAGFSPPLFGHHGKEFLVNSTFKTPAQGKLFALFSSDYSRAGHHGAGWEFSPGLLYGLTDRWSAEFHLHHILVDGDSHMESLGFETRFRILGPGDVHPESGEHHHDEADAPPLSLAALLEYSKGLGASDNIEARVIAGRDLGPLSLVVNLIAERRMEAGEHVEFGYAAGVKANLTTFLAAGLEFDSRAGHDRASRLTPGLYASLSHAIDVRFGATINVGDTRNNGPSWRTTLIYAL